MLKRIPDSLPISDAAKSSAISLDALGIGGGVARRRADAIQVIAQLDSSSWAILGGDVLAARDSTYAQTYSNWYSEPAAGETCAEFVRRSHRESRSYVERFSEPDESTIVYSLVFAPCEGRLLDCT